MSEMVLILLVAFVAGWMMAGAVGGKEGGDHD